MTRKEFQEKIESYEWDGVKIPTDLAKELEFYIYDKQVPGQFIRAVLENDLTKTIQRADLQSLRCLTVLCRFMMHRLPRDAWGDEKQISDWLNNLAVLN